MAHTDTATQRAAIARLYRHTEPAIEANLDGDGIPDWWMGRGVASWAQPRPPQRKTEFVCAACHLVWHHRRCTGDGICADCRENGRR